MLGGRYYPMGVFTPVYPITSYGKTVGLVGCEILVDGPGSSHSVRAVSGLPSCKAIGFIC